MFIVHEKLHSYEVIRMLGMKNYWKFGAELGVKTGISMKPVLDACPELFLFAIDTWEEFEGIKPKYLRSNKLWDHDINYMDYMFRIGNNYKYKNRVQTMKMKTSEAHAFIKDGLLDYVFFDGDSRKEGMLEDLKNWIPKIKLGGYVIGHDYYLKGQDTGVREAVSHFFGEDIVVYDYDKTWFKKL